MSPKQRLNKIKFPVLKRTVIRSALFLVTLTLIATGLISTLRVTADTNSLNVGLPFPGHTGGNAYTGYKQYMSELYSFAIELGSSLAVLMIIYAGYKYMTSSGNQTALNEAKEIFLGAILGLAILLLVYLILNTLGLKATAGIANPS